MRSFVVSRPAFVFVLNIVLSIGFLQDLAADSQEQPRPDTYRYLGLDEKLNGGMGQDFIRDEFALAAIKALLIPGTRLPDGVSDQDARIILRSALKSGALQKRGRLSSDFMKALGIKQLRSTFFREERDNAYGPMPLVNAARNEFLDFMYAFILMIRVAQHDLVEESVFEKLEQSARDALLLMGLDLMKANATDEERKDLLFRLLGFGMNAGLGLDLSQPRETTQSDRSVIEKFFGKIESGAFVYDIQARASRRTWVKTASYVMAWVAAGALVFTLWRAHNYSQSQGLNPALIANLDIRINPLWVQVFVTAIISAPAGIVGFFVHRDRDPLRDLVARGAGRMSSLGVEVSKMIAGTKNLCLNLLTPRGLRYGTDDSTRLGPGHLESDRSKYTDTEEW